MTLSARSSSMLHLVADAVLEGKAQSATVSSKDQFVEVAEEAAPAVAEDSLAVARSASSG